jgi:anaerobic selenocysteine-containing dehydrogenase/Fe-S-cluster-containing dehydrogenase component
MTDRKTSKLNILNQAMPGAAPVAPQSTGETGDLIEKAGISRRGFLKVLGSATALSASACADSATQAILPDVEGDESRVPGVATWYSSTCSECSAGCGILVKTREGRAIKVEGNPQHPINRGGLCAAGQSAVQHLYDPDRIREPLEAVEENGKRVFKPISWSKAIGRLARALTSEKGEKLMLTGAVSGAEKDLLDSWCSGFGVNRAVYNVTDQVALAQASELAFGKYGVPRYNFAAADVVVSFGADYLETWVSPVEFARDWAVGRRRETPSKCYHIEPRLSLTGTNADFWHKNKPGSELQLALGLLKLVLKQGKGASFSADLNSKVQSLVADINPAEVAADAGLTEADLVKIAFDLSKAKHSLVVAGGTAAQTSTSVQLHFVAHLLNIALGNIGSTVKIGSMRTPQSDIVKVTDFISTMNQKAGAVGVLMIKDTNPVFSLPESYGFAYAMKLVPMVVSFSSHMDETTKQAHLILPSHTGLERWGDYEAFDGAHSLFQPSMTPVFDTKQFGDTLLAVAKKGEKTVSEAATFEDVLKARWQGLYARLGSGVASFDVFWRESLERGGVFAQSIMDIEAPVRTSAKAFELKFSKAKFAAKGVKAGVVLYPYASVRNFDGSHSNRAWLQELPDPVTKIVWDTWGEIHPDTAKEQGIADGDVIQLTNDNGQLNVAAFLTANVHPGIVAVPLGDGHRDYGRYAQAVDRGNVFTMFDAKQGAYEQGDAKAVALCSALVDVKRGRGRSDVVMTGGSDNQGFREIARTKFVSSEDAHHGNGHGSEHGAHGDGHGGHHEPKQMYLQRMHPVYKWGMAIDLAACTGCSACVVACYAENNVPVVGKTVAGQGREMAWLRIDRYTDVDESGRMVFSHQPMMCQHCQNAPCEPVCPVYATYHNEQGLNAMVYNRCVGTRYCGNNCSYKVRRFNWFEYDWPEPLNWQLNPDVTKRTAGVMEKCTFCVQRINEATSQAKNEGRAVRDGEVQPACVQSCPTQAISFGNLNDKESKVSKASGDARAYKVLDHHINTQPSVAYLEDIKYQA